MGITPDYSTLENGLVIVDTIRKKQPSKTWGMQLDGNRCVGTKDDVAAIIQSAYSILSTEQGAYAIYPRWYGLNLNDILGTPAAYMYAILCDRIKEALLTDDRIMDVDGFKYEASGDSMKINFSIHVDFTDDEIKGALYV